MSACGAMGPSMVAFLREIYGRAKEADNEVPHVAAARPKALVEHDGSFVVLGHALEHSVRGHGYRVPEPHYPPRQHSQPLRHGAARYLLGTTDTDSYSMIIKLCHVLHLSYIREGQSMQL